LAWTTKDSIRFGLLGLLLMLLCALPYAVNSFANLGRYHVLNGYRDAIVYMIDTRTGTLYQRSLTPDGREEDWKVVARIHSP
jgi:hypothetical protein